MPSNDEMRAAIIDAIKIGEFSQRQIDPKNGGKYAGLLVKGKHVSGGMVGRLYDTLLSIRNPTLSIAKPTAIGEAIDKPSINPTLSIAESITIDEAIDKPSIAIDEMARLRAQVERLENENCQLKSRVEKLETSMAEKPIAPSIANTAAIDGKTMKEVKGGNVLGWSLFRDKGDRWYAIRRIDGQNRSVYIGRDKGKAEEKIKNWQTVYGEGAREHLPNAVETDLRSFSDFVARVKAATESLRERDQMSGRSTGLYRIWEIRERLTDWPRNQFDFYLQQMHRDRIGFLRVYDVPGELSESERAGSLLTDGQVFFYLTWPE